MRVMLTLLLCALAANGCTEKQRPDPDEAALLPTIRLTSAPKPQHALDVRFENKIRLLGYDVSEASPAPNKPFTVTWYWQVVEALDNGYQVFTHLSDGKVNRINLDSDRVARRVYPESRWKKGDFIRDEQEVTLPSDWNSNAAVFYLGFYKDETRLRVTQGKEDGERRAEGLRLALSKPGSDKPEPAVPRLIARRTTGAIQIDGKLDEADWKAAQSSGPFVQTMTGEAGAFEARVQVLYDADKLYCGFVVSDAWLKSSFEHTDDHLWEQDTVEVMLDPDGDGRNYFELQVSPRGVHFDTRYDSARQPRPFGHMDWDSHVDAKVQLHGKLNDETADEGYVVELAVPWSAFAAGEPPASPPGKGDTWRINFFVMDARKEGQRAVGWSPPRIGDFHTLAQFGRVVFLEGAAAAAPLAH
jgi:Carbohydrate family 9 binding domain-like